MLGNIFVSLWAAHKLADYWLQDGLTAHRKGEPGRAGASFCVYHVLVLTATQAVFLAAPALLGLVTIETRWQLLGGLAVNAVSHYVLDRREPLRRLMDAVGKGEFYRLGMPREGRDDNVCLGTGQHALDQSGHFVFAWIAALIMAS